MEAVGEDTSVMAWVAGVAPGSTGLLGDPTGATTGTGAEAAGAEVAAGVAGMSYFCTCSR